MEYFDEDEFRKFKLDLEKALSDLHKKPVKIIVISQDPSKKRITLEYDE